MPIETIVPAVQNALAAITLPSDPTTLLLKGVSDGASQAIPETPWAWVQADDFVSPALSGSDLEQTVWQVAVRLLVQWVADTRDAENRLRPLIEPIRAAFRAHVRLGISPTVADTIVARVTSGRWGYVSVNGIIYRYVDLTVSVTEKIRVAFAA